MPKWLLCVFLYFIVGCCCGCIASILSALLGSDDAEEHNFEKCLEIITFCCFFWPVVFPVFCASCASEYLTKRIRNRKEGRDE